MNHDLKDRSVSNKRGKYLKLIFIAGLVILIDQVTKFAVEHYLPLYHTVEIVPGFFNLTHLLNPGGAFGLMANQGPVIRALLFIVVSLLAAGMVLYFYLKTPETHQMLLTGLAMILGGAAGNLIDRLRMGKVVDFLDFYIKNLHWPAFNVADSAISIGMTIFALHILSGRLPE